jgi:hypothetical protein
MFSALGTVSEHYCHKNTVQAKLGERNDEINLYLR